MKKIILIVILLIGFSLPCLVFADDHWDFFEKNKQNDFDRQYRQHRDSDKFYDNLQKNQEKEWNNRQHFQNNPYQQKPQKPDKKDYLGE
jgi:hypothetical protein